MVGTVKSYKSKYGYGFITSEEIQEDVFFSYRVMDERTIKPGTKVEFDNVKRDRKGLKAGKVTIIE